MKERDYRLEDLVERVADLDSLGNERARLTDVEPEKESWLADNLRMLSVIGSLGPGELGFGTTGPAREWGPLEVMGEVRANDDELLLARDAGTACWLRLLPPARTRPSRGRANLEREAKSLEEIQHPGLARVRGAGAFEGRTGIWAEASEGRWLADLPALPWPDACDLVIALAATVGRLHEHGLIQRRLTSDRILVRSDGPLLLDLGSDEGVAASPEVNRGAAPTVRSDVWALGQLLFEVAGHDPSDEVCSLTHAEPSRRPGTMKEAIELVASMKGHEPRSNSNDRWRRLFQGWRR